MHGRHTRLIGLFALLAGLAATPVPAATQNVWLCMYYESGGSYHYSIAVTRLTRQDTETQFRAYVTNLGASNANCYDRLQKRYENPFSSVEEAQADIHHRQAYWQDAYQFIPTTWSPSEKPGQASIPLRPALKKPAKPALTIAEAAAVQPPNPVGPTANQLRYQRELAAYQERLAEIDRIKVESAASLARDKGAAAAAMAQHEREMEQNRQQVAAAEMAKRRYEQDLAVQLAAVERNRTKQDREALVDWPEAVSVCELNPQNPQSKFGNWRCDGPLQFDYARLGSADSQADPKAKFNVSNTCGGKLESVRDLGMVNGYHVFGCSFGLHPDPAQRMSPDRAARFGIAYVPGRNTYRCPKYVSYCRSK